MRIDGEWLLCDDGWVRPVIHTRVEAADGAWIRATFLVDTGADCTAISAEVLDLLNLPPVEGVAQIGGIGGAADSVIVQTRLQLLCDPRSYGSFASSTPKPGFLASE
jgi:hypothetical protein